MRADDPYAILGIPRSADAHTVHTAYRARARWYHPDVAPGPEAQHRMADLNDAYAVLRDPIRRASWDAEHGLDRHASHALSCPHITTIRFDPAPTARCVWRRGPDGEGAAGPPPGRPAGSVLMFGRHLCWSIGEIARVDLGYLQWLLTRPEGRPFRSEIEVVLQRSERRDARPAGAGAGFRQPFWKR
jgi:curved DNA-binding protein CbpA